MKKYSDFCTNIDAENIDEIVETEQAYIEHKYGPGFSSCHALYALIKEELDEFWDSVKQNDPDPKELIDILVVTRAGVIWLCSEARKELAPSEDLAALDPQGERKRAAEQSNIDKLEAALLDAKDKANSANLALKSALTNVELLTARVQKLEEVASIYSNYHDCI